MPWFCAVPTSKIKVFKVRSKFLLKMLALLPLNYEKNAGIQLFLSFIVSILTKFWNSLIFSLAQAKPIRPYNDYKSWISVVSQFFIDFGPKKGYRSIYIRPIFFHRIQHKFFTRFHMPNQKFYMTPVDQPLKNLNLFRLTL